MTSASALLELLDRANAFEPVPLPGNRRSMYVPFEELLAGNYERRLARDLRACRRTALIGPIGTGKSSGARVRPRGRGRGPGTNLDLGSPRATFETLDGPARLRRASSLRTRSSKPGANRGRDV